MWPLLGIRPDCMDKKKQIVYNELAIDRNSSATCRDKLAIIFPMRWLLLSSVVSFCFGKARSYDVSHNTC